MDVKPFIFANDANDRVVYLSGPHGVGKSTLVEGLKQQDSGIDVVEQVAHMESLEEQMSRQIWRIGLHVIEHRENLIAASDRNDVTILGDRCALDDLAYTMAFMQLGWLDKKELSNVRKMESLVYKLSSTPFPKRFVIILPPLDWNIARIEGRWKEGEEVKWQERDYTYLTVVRQQFEEIAKPLVKKNRAVVIRATDSSTRVRQVSSWIKGDILQRGNVFVERQKDRVKHCASAASD